MLQHTPEAQAGPLHILLLVSDLNTSQSKWSSRSSRLVTIISTMPTFMVCMYRLGLAAAAACRHQARKAMYAMHRPSKAAAAVHHISRSFRGSSGDEAHGRQPAELVVSK